MNPSIPVSVSRSPKWPDDHQLTGRSVAARRPASTGRAFWSVEILLSMPPHCSRGVGAASPRAMPAGCRRYCAGGVRVQSAASAAGRADRRPLLPGGCAAVRPAEAAADAVGVAHRQPRGAVPHPRRHRHRDGRVRRRLRGHHAHPRVEFGYPLRTRSVGVHFKPWGLAPFLPMPAAELCDRPVTVEQVWGRPAIAELRDRLATADGPHEMLTLLEEELRRRLCETAGLGLVRHTSSVIAATSGAVAIGDLSVAAGVSSTHLAQRFKELIGVTPKRLARTYRFAATVFAINPAGPVDWGDLAGGAGYFDQAHFGHEFRAFTGLTPTRYIEVRRRFLREHPGHALDGWPLPAD